MKKSKFTDQQIAFALNQAEAGTSVEEVCRKMGISQATFFRWKKVYGGLMPSEVRRLKQLEEENSRLRKLVADLTLDKEMLTEVIKKRSDAGAGQRDDRLCENGLPGLDPPGLPRGSGAALDLSLCLRAAAAGYFAQANPGTRRDPCSLRLPAHPRSAPTRWVEGEHQASQEVIQSRRPSDAAEATAAKGHGEAPQRPKRRYGTEPGLGHGLDVR